MFEFIGEVVDGVFFLFFLLELYFDVKEFIGWGVVCCGESFGLIDLVVCFWVFIDDDVEVVCYCLVFKIVYYGYVLGLLIFDCFGLQVSDFDEICCIVYDEDDFECVVMFVDDCMLVMGVVGIFVLFCECLCFLIVVGVCYLSFGLLFGLDLVVLVCCMGSGVVCVFKDEFECGDFGLQESDGGSF